MKIIFPNELYRRLLARANEEHTTIPTLVCRILCDAFGMND